VNWNLKQKKGKRASRACKECKINRRKCDGKDPCQPCLEMGTPMQCNYEVPKKRGRRAKKDIQGHSEKKPKFETPDNIPFVAQERVVEEKEGIATTSKAAVPSFKLSATIPSFSFVPVVPPTTTTQNNPNEEIIVIENTTNTTNTGDSLELETQIEEETIEIKAEFPDKPQSSKPSQSDTVFIKK